MPITFATDLKDLEKFDYVEQLPVEAIFKNLGYKQAKYDQEAKAIQSSIDPLWDIPAVGPDVARKAEIINEFNNRIRQYANKDLSSDKAAKAALQADIAQMRNDYELNQIAQRGAYAKSMEAKRRELTKDGSYIDDVNDEFGQELANYTEYDPRVVFRGNIYKNYDFNSLYNTAVEKSPKWEEMKKAPNGQQQHYAGTATSQIQTNIINGIKQDPAAYREKMAEFTKNTRGIDWSKNDVETSLAQLQKAEALYKEYMSLADAETNPVIRKGYEDKAKEMQNHGKFWSDFASSAYVNPEIARQYAFDEWLANDAYTIAVAHTNYALKSQNTSDIALADHNEALHRVSNKQSAWYQANLDRGNVSATPNASGYGDVNPAGTNNITPKPSGKVVKVANIEAEAPYIVESVENAFDPDAPKTDFLKTIIANKYGSPIFALKIKMKLKPDGRLHFYVPDDPSKPDDDSPENTKKSPDFGTYDKSAIYSMIPANLNKEAEEFKKNKPNIVIGNKSFKKVVNEGVAYPLVSDPADIQGLPPNTKYVTPNSAGDAYIIKLKT